MNTLSRVAAVALGFIALGAPPAHAQGALPGDSLERGRRYVRWFLSAEVDSLAANMSPSTFTGLGGRDGLTRQAMEVAARAGELQGVVQERFVWRNGSRQYWHAVNSTLLGEPLLVRIVLAQNGQMTGLGLGVFSSAPPIDSGGPPVQRP